MVTNTKVVAAKKVLPESVRVTFGDGEFMVLKEMSPSGIDALIAQAERRIAALRYLKTEMVPPPPGVKS